MIAPKCLTLVLLKDLCRDFPPGFCLIVLHSAVTGRLRADGADAEGLQPLEDLVTQTGMQSNLSVPKAIFPYLPQEIPLNLLHHRLVIVTKFLPGVWPVHIPEGRHSSLFTFASLTSAQGRVQKLADTGFTEGATGHMAPSYDVHLRVEGLRGAAGEALSPGAALSRQTEKLQLSSHF